MKFKILFFLLFFSLVCYGVICSQDLPGTYSDNYSYDEEGEEPLPEFLAQRKKKVEKDTYIELKAQGWLANLGSATMKVDNVNYAGSRFDFNDVGIDRSKVAPCAEGYIEYGQYDRLGFSGFYINRSGSQKLREDIIFNGNTYGVGDNLDSEVTISHFSIYYEYGLVTPKETETKLTIFGQIGVSYNSWHLELRDLTKSITDDEKIWILMPRFGLRAEREFSISKLNFKLETGGFFEFLPKIGNQKGAAVEGYIDINFLLLDKVGAGIGYHFYRANLTNRESSKDVDKADYTIYGPYLNVFVKF